MTDPVAATVGICNQRGLHARASAKFVKLASTFDSEIRVTRDGVTVNALSIMGLLMLGAGNGCDVHIEAEGPDAIEAVEALSDLVNRKFDEDQ
ncbi:MAG TPA: HPr family phosphocarrier protein [Brevundimonas sp.]|nr:HPr family phosphocarrier protein [Brevundimonas sp.]